MKSICPRCRLPISPTARFCARCKYQFTRRDRAKRLLAPIVCAIAAVSVVGIAIILYANWPQSESETVADRNDNELPRKLIIRPGFAAKHIHSGRTIKFHDGTNAERITLSRTDFVVRVEGKALSGDRLVKVLVLDGPHKGMVGFAPQSHLRSN